MEQENGVNTPVETPKIKRLKAKDFVFIILVTGLLFTCLLIMILEVSWDAIWKHFVGSDKTLIRELIESFFRAALIEETLKFLGFLIAYKARKINHPAMAMWAFGCIGLTYGIFEKAAFFNLMAFIVGTAIPMHLLWGLNSGRHFQNFMDAKKEENKKKAAKECLMFTLVPFLIHGCWDAALSLSGHFGDNTTYQNIATIIFIVVVILGIVYMVLTIIKTVKATKQYRREIKEEGNAQIEAPSEKE